MGAMLRRFCAVSFCHRLPEPGKLTSRPHIQVNAKNAKRDAKKKQSQMQKARLAKEFDTNRSAGFSFLG